MKKTIFFLYVLSLLICKQSGGQIPEAEWEKDLAIKGNSCLTDVIQNSDGTYTVLGSRSDAGPEKSDLWLIRFSASGDTVWSRTFANPGMDLPFRIAARPDGGYLMASVNEVTSGQYFARVISTDADGKEQWNKTSTEALHFPNTDIAVQEDGSWWWLLTVAALETPAATHLIHMSPSGETMSDHIFTDKHALEAHALRILPDGTLAVSGEIALDKGGSTMWMMRIKPTGEQMWKSTLPITGKNIRPECICCSNENGLLAAGWIGSCMNPDAAPEDRIYDYDLVITKIDPNGKVLWTKNYDREGSEGGNALAVMPDGHILVAGKCETSFTGTIGPWLMLIDPSGKMVMDHVDKFRFSGDQASRIILTSDGGFVMVGPGRHQPTQNRSIGWIKKYKPLQ
ncbi:hypothetical protein BA6E_103159 [Bacteroidales bacterium 6E]|nr:hypothetical protein BA6E_103159 [Bacteroidales bacterium 6E]